MSIRKRAWWIDLYLPEIAIGMFTTLKHLFFHRRFTLQYPEQRRRPSVGYRGEHRMKKDGLGRPKCKACFLCVTVCPSCCISVQADRSPWPDIEKIPVKFEIDTLRCIYCGMCEEACPSDAIYLSQEFPSVATSRQERIFNLERLLSQP
jgi:NADH-quinone oxidoreductase subunit I